MLSLLSQNRGGSYLAVVFVEQLVADTLEFAPGQDGEQLPADVEGLFNAPVGVEALGDIDLLEFVGEFCIELVDIRQSCLAEDDHQLLGVLASGVGGEELVHRVGVVGSGLALADALILESGEGGEHVDGRVDALAEKLTELRCAADDAAELVRDLRDSLEFEPGELDELESRLDVIYRLKKKYGATEADMLAYLESCKKELDQIQYSSDILARLEKKQAVTLKEAQMLGSALSTVRRESADALEARIQKELEQLDMPKVRFHVEFSPNAAEYGMDATGMDEVQFLMSANVGEALKPIQKIASGGELARIMLALKNVLAENDDVSTLVFDEVDTGVSGRAAQKVAEKMADVARHKQVLCVTHLPQIAAMADTHFSVEKGERDGRTYTAVERLDKTRRREELARLTGGAHITSAMLESAGELLEAAETYKRGYNGEK